MQSSHQAELEFLKIPLVAAAEFRETPLQAGGLAELEFLKICFKQAILRNSTVFKGGASGAEFRETPAWPVSRPRRSFSKLRPPPAPQRGIWRNSCVASFQAAEEFLEIAAPTPARSFQVRLIACP